MVYFRRKPSAGLIHHSDRDSQNACQEYQRGLQQFGMIPGMSRKRDRWDNAPTERFSRSLKSERLEFCRFEPRQTARLEVRYYTGVSSVDHLHSALDDLSPMVHEKE